MSSRLSTPPTLRDDGNETHPAWGRISVTRSQGTPRAVFDSDIRHSHAVHVTLSGASRRRDLNRDYIYAEKVKFEVEFSESQWAAFVASVGQGSGTSCTIRYDGSQDDPITPEFPFESRLRESSNEVRQAAHKAVEEVREAFAVVQEKPNKGNLRHLQAMIDNLPANLAFAADSLTEHTENVVQKARADIEAMVVARASQLGLNAGDLIGTTPELTAGVESERA